MYTELYQKIGPSIVGLGIGNPPVFQILGTGFVVSKEGLIATNEHVATSLLIERGGVTMICGDATAMFFVRDPMSPSDPNVMGMLAIPIASVGLAPEPSKADGPPPPLRGFEPVQAIPAKRPDVALVRIDRNKCPPDIKEFFPVPKILARSLRAGEQIAICGFPQGLYFPEKYTDQDELQLAPVLQIGHVAAVLPFDGVSVPHQYILDLPVNQGSSGSPLLLADGTVVGIVYATRRYFERLCKKEKDGSMSQSDNYGTYLPASLGLAVPATRFPHTLIK